MRVFDGVGADWFRCGCFHFLQNFPNRRDRYRLYKVVAPLRELECLAAVIHEIVFVAAALMRAHMDLMLETGCANTWC